MHLRQPAFIYTDCLIFTKNKEQIQEFKETGDWRYIYQDELDKACVKYDITCGGFKDLPKGKIKKKILCDRAFIFAKYQNMTHISVDVLQWFTHFLKKMTAWHAN